MPVLNWSAAALAAQRDKHKRQQMGRLFDAYFRVADADKLKSSMLYLDLPGEGENRYHFHARFRSGRGWIVEAELKRENLVFV